MENTELNVLKLLLLRHYLNTGFNLKLYGTCTTMSHIVNNALAQSCHSDDSAALSFSF